MLDKQVKMIYNLTDNNFYRRTFFMKLFKRIAAAGLSAVLALTVAGCHSADAVVATYDDIKITSGVYLAMILEADGEARTEIDNQREDLTAAIEDYSKETVSTEDGDVKFYDYIKDGAKERIYQYIGTEVLAKKYEVKLSDEDVSGLDTYVNYYWNNYGYGMLYEPNGVGFDSYKDYIRNAGHLRGKVFTAIYGEDGANPVAEADIKKYMDENYCIANVITENFTSTDAEGATTTLTDDQKKEKLDALKALAERINNGEDFETVYHEYSGTKHEGADEETDEAATEETASETATEETASETSTEAAEEEKELKPLDSHATLLSSAETGSESENFAEILKMAVGEVKVFENESNYTLVVKGDIDADPYYIDSLDETIRHALKGDEFNKLLVDEAKKLDIKFNEGELRYLSPKKVTYDVY